MADFDYELTPEYLRLKAFEDARVEKYLTERTPEEMRQDLWEHIAGNDRMIANLTAQIDIIRADSIETYVQLGFQREQFDG